MPESAKVEKLAVVLPDGSKSEIDHSIASKYGFQHGWETPFSRQETTKILKSASPRRGKKDWSEADDQYLLEHWNTMTRSELAKRLEVSQAALSRRYKAISD